MAERPVYEVCLDNDAFVKTKNIEFDWYSGFAVSQKQKCIDSLHSAYNLMYPDSKVLEISSKSRDEVGVMLSAFNLGFPSNDGNKIISVECVFQGSKVFEGGGPYTDLYYVESVNAKKDIRIKESGKLISFAFFNQTWPLNPKTLFYDWIYINALYRNKELYLKAVSFDSFTDIEFNPAKSINCQAKSAALFVSLYKRGILDSIVLSKDAYMNLFCSVIKKRINYKVGEQLLIPGFGFDSLAR